VVAGAVIALVLCMASGISWGAALRDGVDCGCSKTGVYDKNQPRTKKFATSVPLAATSSVYRAEIADPGGFISIGVSRDGSRIYHTTLVTANVRNGVTGVMAGFSPDDDRFVFYWVGTDSVFSLRLVDLAADQPEIVASYDLNLTSGQLGFAPDISVGFAPTGRFLVLAWPENFPSSLRVIDVRTGQEVFTESSALDFNLGVTTTPTPWGFSPDGRYLVYHYVSGATGNQRHYVRAYDLTASGGAAQTVAYDVKTGSAVLRFSPVGPYLLDASATSVNGTSLQVWDLSTGDQVYTATFTFDVTPGETGDKFRGAGWGFGPKGKSLLYAVDTGPSTVAFYMVNLATGGLVLDSEAVEIGSGFWLFSPCGDTLAVVLQGASGITGRLYRTVDGALLATKTSAAGVAWNFQSTASGHQVSLDGGTWQTMAANTAADSCSAPPADTEPPAWPDGAALGATVDHGTVTLSWPAATDADAAVASYIVLQDGKEISTVAASTTTYTVQDLTAGKTYLFRIEAEDTAGNRTSSGLEQSVQFADWIPPAWPAGAVLTVSDTRHDRLTLHWPEATDDTRVASYLVSKGALPIETLPGTATSFTVTGLSFSRTYSFGVVAVDPDGNRSALLGTDASTAGPPDTATPPAWPAAAALALTAEDATTVHAAWPTATDATGLAGYRVFLNGRRIAELPAGQREFTLDGLLPDADWNVAVQPYNVWLMSGPSLSSTVRTAAGAVPDPPLPAPLISDLAANSDLEGISADGRFVYFKSTDTRSSGFPRGVWEFLYDRSTGKVFGLPAATVLVSADGRHAVVYETEIEPGYPPKIAAIRVRDLATGIDKDLMRLRPAREFAEVAIHGVSLDGDRALVSVEEVVDVGRNRRQYTLIVADAGGNEVQLVVLEDLKEARLSRKGDRVLVWSSAPWFRIYDLANGGFETVGLPADVVRLDWSADGTVLVFTTAESLLPEDISHVLSPVHPHETDVYAYDLVTGRFDLVSYGADGKSVGGDRPTVSGDGRYVAYEEGPCWSDGSSQSVVSVTDRWLGTSRCIVIEGRWSNDCWGPKISDNGRYVTLQSDAIAETGVHLVDLAWQEPSWPPGAVLRVTSREETAVGLSWTPARDLVGFPAALGQYVVYRDGSEIHKQWVVQPGTGTPATSYRVTGLSPSTVYAFQVQLLDASGTESTDGPTVRVATLGPVVPIERCDAFTGTSSPLVYAIAALQIAADSLFVSSADRLGCDLDGDGGIGVPEARYFLDRAAVLAAPGGP